MNSSDRRIIRNFQNYLDAQKSEYEEFIRFKNSF